MNSRAREPRAPLSVRDNSTASRRLACIREPYASITVGVGWVVNECWPLLRCARVAVTVAVGSTNPSVYLDGHRGGASFLRWLGAA
jgi:hypothetical protein